MKTIARVDGARVEAVSVRPVKGSRCAICAGHTASMVHTQNVLGGPFALFCARCVRTLATVLEEAPKRDAEEPFSNVVVGV